MTKNKPSTKWERLVWLRRPHYETEPELVKEVRFLARNLADHLYALQSRFWHSDAWRSVSLAITKLEECTMHAVKWIYIDEKWDVN
jgi:hypothetical protein